MDWKVIVLVYSAVLSTFAAAWRIYEFLYDKKGRIEVYIITVSDEITRFYSDLEYEYSLTALITNKGNKARFVKVPYFSIYPSMLLDEHKRKILDQLPELSKVYPIKLDPGEQFKYDIDMPTLVKYKKAGARKVRVEISDTHNKVYKSKWKKL